MRPRTVTSDVTWPVTDTVTREVTGAAPVAGYTHTPNGYSFCGTYTGTGAALAITGLGFQPDFIIIARGASNEGKFYQRTLLGVGNYQHLHNAIAVVDTESVTAFDADGFTLGTSTASNDTGVVYRYIAWKAVAAFSAGIAYTGTGVAKTEAHGLGATPNIIAVKNSAAAIAWGLYLSAVASPETKRFSWVATLPTVSTTSWNDTVPDGTNITVGTATQTNVLAGTYIGYTMADVAGVVKIGTYTGNGNASGPVVSGLGFSPRGLLTFNTGINNNGAQLAASDVGASLSLVDVITLVGADTAADAFTFDADGFTVTTASAEVNGNTNIILYIAFAA